LREDRLYIAINYTIIEYSAYLCRIDLDIL
jgi:hypothetical protein